jgi:hypothetical protein
MPGRYTGRVEAAEEDLDGWTCREPAAAVTSFAVASETRFWDSTELVRISAKFIHFGEVRNEFYASYSKNSPN